jgi:hypothetical protein
MHEVFAATRVWQLEHVQGLRLHANAVAHRIFGTERWQKCNEGLASLDDDRTRLMQLCFNILHSSGWYDDPNDSNRTMANMEMASIKYIDDRLPYMDNWPIYVEDESNPKCMVGIEQHFDCVVEYSDGKLIRIIGTIDGVVMKKLPKGEWILDENKTAVRLDTGWRDSFEISHQVTGYCACGTSVFGFPMHKSRIIGVKIKPTNKGEDVVPVEPMPRSEESYRAWARWLRYTVDLYEQYKDDYENAPLFTHSCNRYFRPCSLISFCGDTAEGRKQQWSEMVPIEPSPSERAVQEI